MEFLDDLFELKGLLLIVLIFVPLEQLLPMHADQKTFRRGWLNDLVYLFFNVFLIKLGSMAVVVPVLAVSYGPVPPGLRQAVASQPDWVQAIEVIVVADLGFYAMHRLFH